MASESRLALGPMGRSESQWVHAEWRPVDQEVLSPDEEPMAFAACIGVVVLDGVDDPAVAVGAPVLDLAAAVYDSGGRIGAVEIDHVVADVEEGDAHAAQTPIEVFFEGCSPNSVPRYAYVGDEERCESVDVSCVEADRIASSQLADLFIGDESFDGLGGVRGLGRRRAALSWIAQ